MLHERIKQLENENYDLNNLAKRLLIESIKCCKCEIYIAKKMSCSKLYEVSQTMKIN